MLIFILNFFNNKEAETRHLTMSLLLTLNTFSALFSTVI